MSDTPLVVLDANAVGVDPPLGRISHRTLLDAHRAGAIVLAVPELSLDEALNTWRRNVDGHLKRHAETLRPLERYVPNERWSVRRFDFRAASAAMRAEMADALGRAGVLMPGLPDVGHDVLAELAMGRRQPFDAEGSGYRDSLLWHTVLALAEEHADVVLVSSDHSAFAQGRTEGGALASRLEREARERAGAVLRIRLLAHAHDAVAALDLVPPAEIEAAVAVLRRMRHDAKAVLEDRFVESMRPPIHRALVRHVGNPFLVEHATLWTTFGAVGLRVGEVRRDEDGRLDSEILLDMHQHVLLTVPRGLVDRIRDPVMVFGPRDDEETLWDVEVDAVVTHRLQVVLDPTNDTIVDASYLEPSGARAPAGQPAS